MVARNSHPAALSCHRAIVTPAAVLDGSGELPAGPCFGGSV